MFWTDSSEPPAPEDYPVIMAALPGQRMFTPQIVRKQEQFMEVIDAGGERWTPMKEVQFDPSLAYRMLDFIRDGGTLKEFCFDCGLPRSIIYGWMRSENNLGDDSFADLMLEAEKDRARSWQDDMIHDYDRITLTGRREDASRVRKAESLAGLKLKLAKEALARGNTTGGAGGVPKVFLMSFSEVDLPEPPWTGAAPVVEEEEDEID